jgi:membrane associated rhomboid family serine protease
MKVEEFLKRFEAEKERQPEIALVLKMSFLLLIIMAAKMFLGRYFVSLLLFFAFYYFLFQLAKGLSSDLGVMQFLAQNFTFIFAPYLEGKDRYKEAPILTYVIILVNVFVFYMFDSDGARDFIGNNLLFLPILPNLINVPLSLLAHIFLHADASHLWGNMIFLWAIGTVIERRIGSTRFLYCYFIAGVFASLVSILIYFIFLDEIIHGLGASGAVSGLMGAYLIRCYFKTMAIPIPLLGVFPINVKIRVNSFVIMSLFFLLDLDSGFDQVLGMNDSNTNYFAHLGGFAMGVYLAKRMQLMDQAVEERHLERGIKVWNDGTWNERALAKGMTPDQGIKSLTIALEKNQHNPEILLHLARLKSQLKSTEEAKRYYCRAIALMITSSFDEVTEVFREYCKKYSWNLDIAPAQLYQLAGLLYKEGDLDPAERLMTMVVEDATATVDLKEKAMFQSVKMLAEMNLPEASRGMFHKFTNTFPQSPRLDQLKTIISEV